MFFDDYYLLEYIQSSGAQYINSGVSLGSNNFEVDATIVEYQSSSNESAIFSIWTSSYNYWNFFIRSDQGLDCYVNDHYVKGNIVVGNKYDVQVKRSGNSWQYGIIGSLGSISFSRGDNNTTLKFLTRGDANNSSSHIRLYRAKVLVSGNLVRDFVPAQRKSDNVIGLYDLVNDVFYTNAGSGTFTAGHIVDVSANFVGWGSASLEMDGDKAVITAVANQGYEFVDWTLGGYTQLDYIESTGTQYIDTKYVIKNTDTLDFDITLLSGWLLFSSNGVSSSGYQLLIQNNCVASGASNATKTYANFNTTLPNNTRLQQKITFNSNSVSFSGYTSGSGSLATIAQNEPFLLFGRTNALASMRIYSLAIKDQNDNLVRDFIPVIRHSDAQIGLLDLVNLKFYGNSGTGQFIGGNPI